MPQAGTYTAYQQLKPIQTDFGKIAKDEEALAFKYREEDRLKKKAEQDEIDKLDFETQAQIITGVESLDQGLAIGIDSANQAQYEDYNKAKNDPAFRGSTEYKIRNQNLDNYSANVDLIIKGVKSHADTLREMTGKGTISGWDKGKLDMLNGFFAKQKVSWGHNKYGEPIGYVAVADDEEPDGIAKDENGKPVLKKIRAAEVLQGIGDFEVTEFVDITKKGQDMGSSLGKSISSTVRGYNVTSEQAWESRIEDTRNAIKPQLGTPKNPTALTKRLWTDIMGRDVKELTPEDMVEVENTYLSQIKAYYDVEVKNDPNFSAQESANTRRQKEQEERSTPEYVPDTETGAPSVTTVDGKSANIIAFGDGKAIPTLNTETQKEAIQNIYITDGGEIYADKITESKYKGDPVLTENGDVDWVATVAKQNAKGWEREDIGEPVKLTDTDFTNLAKNPKIVDSKGDKFKDGKALKDFLKEKKKSLPQSETKSQGVGAKYNKN